MKNNPLNKIAVGNVYRIDDDIMYNVEKNAASLQVLQLFAPHIWSKIENPTPIYFTREGD